MTEFDPLSDHGGNLTAACSLFPDAPEPWIDLSTGICPFPYPLPTLPQSAFTRLPEPAAHARLLAAAARAYRAPSPRYVCAAPGTQILLPLVCSLLPPGRAAILSPTYSEHARAAALVGHEVSEPGDLKDLAGADIAIIVNPNNPDGRLRSRECLLDLASRLAERSGLLIIDEAFMDTTDDGESLAASNAANVILLRSFGKFYGMAGLRLGFAIARPDITDSLRGRLGPWAVSGPALSIGETALADERWRETNRRRIAESAGRLDRLLIKHGLDIVGGTALYRLVQSARSAAVFRTLMENGVLVRRFAHRLDWLRFGLPGSEESWYRLGRALKAAAETRERISAASRD